MPDQSKVIAEKVQDIVTHYIKIIEKINEFENLIKPEDHEYREQLKQRRKEADEIYKSTLSQLVTICSI